MVVFGKPRRAEIGAVDLLCVPGVLSFFWTTFLQNFFCESFLIIAVLFIKIHRSTAKSYLMACVTPGVK